MAIKDWKKVGKDYWKNHKTKEEVHIINLMVQEGAKGYDVWVGHPTRGVLFTKVIDLKVDAKEEAMDYMRKH